MCTGEAREFQAKYFLFNDCKPAQFYRSQWTNRNWLFWLIKALMLVYWLTWFVISLLQKHNLHRFWIYLTHWDMVLILLYLLASFSVVTYGLKNKTDEIKTAKKSQIATISEAGYQKQDRTIRTQKLRWFHVAVWLLNVVALDVAIITTVTFWGLLTPTNVTTRSVNNHAVNSVIMILDLLLNDIPVRFLHFYHASLFSAIYVVFSAVLHLTGYESAVYPVLNWENNPGLAAALGVGVTLIGCFLVHSFVFGMYKIKLFVAQKTVLKDDMSNAVTDSKSKENLI